MSTTTNVQNLHSPRPCAYAALQAASCVTAQDLGQVSASVLYAAITEHWDKCTSEAQNYLLTHENSVIQSHAFMISTLIGQKRKLSVA